MKRLRVYKDTKNMLYATKLAHKKLFGETISYSYAVSLYFMGEVDIDREMVIDNHNRLRDSGDRCTSDLNIDDELLRILHEYMVKLDVTHLAADAVLNTIVRTTLRV